MAQTVAHNIFSIEFSGKGEPKYQQFSNRLEFLDYKTLESFERMNAPIRVYLGCVVLHMCIF